MSFIKWAGGKRNLLKHIVPKIIEHIDENVNNVYVEPFLGSGSVLINLLLNHNIFDKYVCADLNEHLINTFNEVKNNPEMLISDVNMIHAYFVSLDTEQREQYYYLLRDIYNMTTDKHLKAVLFVVLNKSCFRGLYRVSKDNKFNCPYGHYMHKAFINDDYIRRLSALFVNVDFIHTSYKEIYKYLPNNYTVTMYLDPPYYKTTDIYTADKFDSNDFITFLNHANHKCVVSNSKDFLALKDRIAKHYDVLEISVCNRANPWKPSTPRFEVVITM